MMNFDRTTEQYFRFLEALGQAVIATDAAGVIAVWNAAAEALYGWRAEEVLGRNVLEVTPMDVSRAQSEEIMQALGRGEIWSGEFQVRTRKGKSLVASVTDIPLLDDARAVAGVIGVSAASHAPTKLEPLLKRLAAACNKVWPDQIRFHMELPAKASLAATEPHMIQLLALLLLLYADAAGSRRRRRGHRAHRGEIPIRRLRTGLRVDRPLRADRPPRRATNVLRIAQPALLRRADEIRVRARAHGRRHADRRHRPGPPQHDASAPTARFTTLKLPAFLQLTNVALTRLETVK
jgi:PAS domain S-box-containing protein